MPQEKHYPALDGLRGFAAVAVVEFHLGHWLGVKSLTGNGSLAVDLFFCLSGYVLPLAYGPRNKSNLTFAAFAGARLLRLMPLILLATFISGAYAAFRLEVLHEDGLYGAWLTAFALGLLVLPYFDAPPALGGPQLFPLNGPQYTLFLEFLINFVWFPIRRFAPLGMALALAAAGGVLIGIFGYGGDKSATFWLGIPRVTASFFAGVTMFEVERRFDVARHLKYAFWPLFALMVALFAYPGRLAIGVSLVWIMAVSPLLVLSGLRAEMNDWLRQLCLFGGKLSYPIYVLQYPLFCWMNGMFQMFIRHKMPYVEMPLILAGILLGSYAMLRWIDAPVRHMLAVRRRGAVAATPIQAPSAPL